VKEKAIQATPFQGGGEMPATIGITPASCEGGFPHHVEPARKKRAGIREKAGGKTEYIVWAHGIHARFYAVPEDLGPQAQTPKVFLVEGFVRFLVGDCRGTQIHMKDPAEIAFAYSLGLIVHRIASELYLKDINNIRAKIKQKEKTPNSHGNIGSGRRISICVLG
jgi:hypothetical protein